MNSQSKALQRFINVYLPIILFLIAFLWKFYYIDTRDICLDEPFTIFHAQHSFWDIIKLPANNEPNPPLFMVLLHFWIKLFGIEPHSVRILPLVFNALTAVFIYLIGKKFYSLPTALLASGIFILSTYHFYFGLETRAYSLLSLATAASLFYFQSLIAKPESIRYLMALVVWNFVLVYSHYFGWFVVFVQFIAGLLYLKERLVFRRVFIAIIATALLFTPMAVVFIKQFFKSSQGTWVQPPSRFEYVHQLYWFFNAKKILFFLLLAIVVGLAYTIYTKRKVPAWRQFVVVFLWWFIPYTIMFLVSFKVPMFINRYILFNTIGLYLLAAILINSLFTERVAIIVGCALLGMLFLKLQINSKDFYYREVKNSVLAVKQHKTDSTKVLLYPYWTDLGFMYYYDRSIFEDYANFDSLLEAKGFVRYWDSNHFKHDKNKPGDSRVIYVHNGDLNDTAVYRYLDSTMVKTDSVFFPQCFIVAVFEPRK